MSLQSSNWPNIFAAIKGWISKGSGIPAAMVIGVNDKQPHKGVVSNMHAVAAWQITEIQPIGTQPPFRYFDLDEDDPDSPQGIEILGDRILRVRVVFESLSQQPNRFAFLYAERLRSASELPHVDKILNDAGMGCADIESTRVADFEDANQRYISRAEFDVVLHASICTNMNAEGVYSDDDEPASLIQHVEIQSDLRNVDGEEMPESLRFHEIIPPIEEEI